MKKFWTFATMIFIVISLFTIAGYLIQNQNQDEVYVAVNMGNYGYTLENLEVRYYHLAYNPAPEDIKEMEMANIYFRNEGSLNLFNSGDLVQVYWIKDRGFYIKISDLKVPQVTIREE